MAWNILFCLKLGNYSVFSKNIQLWKIEKGMKKDIAQITKALQVKKAARGGTETSGTERKREITQRS